MNGIEPVAVEFSGGGPGGRSGRGVVLNSVLWAFALTVALLFSAAVNPWSVWLGVVIMLAAVAVAGCLVGGIWHRAGAAVLVCCAGFALPLFAGSAMYDGYMRTVGEPVDAVVTGVVDRDQRRGPDMFCTVRELGGERRTYEVSQRENCFGQAEPGDRVVVREDPLGLLDPRLPDGPGQGSTAGITLASTAGLTLLVAGGVLYGGLRRRG
ncbi:hypothetical protein [Streptomyces sp. NRRL S-37]|uniref:hypothetical protein n=1 Tax=Streptomyces sp. NRRL S-37 TaxID=1463903 RepID=UPI0004C61F76|nr:hypothetical protein [Streptomyces sp. NRRL S-37]